MKKEIIDLTDNIDVIKRKAGNALTTLGDLLQDYSFSGEEPTAKEAEKYSWEAGRILRFIDISFDYVCDIKKEINQVCADLNNLHDMVWTSNAAPADDDQEENYKEQIDAILNNMNAAEIKKVCQFALNMMLSEVKA